MKRNITSRLMFAGILMVALSAAAPAWTQVTPPDLTVCDGLECETLPKSICSDAGFRITLTNYDPATSSNYNTATYTYEIYNPPKGKCVGGAHVEEFCYDNQFCRSQSETNPGDPGSYCNRECAVDNFYNLSHFAVTFPELGGTDSCLAENTTVEGECDCVPYTTEGCSVYPNVVLGDEDCFGNAPATSGDKVVAGCYVQFGFNPGFSLIMNLRIFGEFTDLRLGAAVAVVKIDQNCNASCLPGPSCAICEAPPPNAEACLTRTHGFWGTHPDIAAAYDPVTVCGVVVDGQNEGECSTSEALCSNAKDNKDNPPYLSLVAQLTAANLNLNATKSLFGGSCSTWRYDDKSIQDWISDCEISSCDASKEGKHFVGSSGCIEALTAFNESKDMGFDVIPPPFDRPGPADPSYCQAARGNGKYIGLDGGLSCATPPP